MKHLVLSFFLLFAVLVASAQHEYADTLSIKANQPISPTLSTDGDSVRNNKSLYEYQERFNEYRDSIGAHNAPSIYYPAIYPGTAGIVSWHNGAFTAGGRTEVFLGLMAIDSGILNFYQQLGHFTFTAYGTATKIGYYNGLSTQWGYGGSLSYQITDNLSITAFGSYATRTSIAQPAMLGYVDYPKAGGYLQYHFGDSHWGVKAGAQSYYSLGSNHWQTQPIVMPYYRTSSGHEFGIDVGGILYNIFRNSSSKVSNPTIAPPKLGPPPVR